MMIEEMEGRKEVRVMEKGESFEGCENVTKRLLEALRWGFGRGPAPEPEPDLTY